MREGEIFPPAQKLVKDRGLLRVLRPETNRFQDLKTEFPNLTAIHVESV